MQPMKKFDISIKRNKKGNKNTPQKANLTGVSGTLSFRILTFSNFSFFYEFRNGLFYAWCNSVLI